MDDYFWDDWGTPTGNDTMMPDSVWMPATSAAGGGDWFSGTMGGLGSLLQNAGQSYIDVWRQKMLTQNTLQGQQYIEGQRLQGTQAMISSLMPLILIGGVVVLAVMLVKD